MNEDCGTNSRWRRDILLTRVIYKYAPQIFSGKLSVEEAAEQFLDEWTRLIHQNYYNEFVNVRDIGLGQEAISPIENSDRQGRTEISFDEISRKMIFGEEHCNKFADLNIVFKNGQSIDIIDLTKEESEPLDQFLSQFKIVERGVTYR